MVTFPNAFWTMVLIVMNQFFIVIEETSSSKDITFISVFHIVNEIPRNTFAMIKGQFDMTLISCEKKSVGIKKLIVKMSLECTCNSVENKV